MKKIEIIAEIGQNHNGDMKLAFELIQEAKRMGADVAKFQLYDAKALFPKENNPWYEYNCQTELSMSQLEALKAECDRVGIEFMASVFDTARVDWLEELGVKRYKIASRSIYDTNLIARLSQTQKDLIVSLGYWKEKEFPKILTKAKVLFLYCVSEYPTPLQAVHLDKVDFTRYAGFSDHTISLTASMAALARGAKILERHLTLDKTMFGPDHALSMTPGDLKVLSNYRDELEIILGLETTTQPTVKS